MIFIESNENWTKDDAWAAAKAYATACRTNPHLRTYGVIAKRFQLPGKYGPQWAWGVFAGKLADSAERSP